MNLIYNAAIRLYGAAAHVAAAGSPKVRRMLDGQAETMQRLKRFRAEMAPEGFDVWFHAASLGEFEQARPLIEALLTHRPSMKILLSFFSPSGYEVRRDFNPSVAVVYMPFDTPAAAKEFLDIAAPRKAVFVKYEFWGNYLSELKRRGIGVSLISAIFRPSQAFFKPWGGMMRGILHKFDRLYVQDEASRSLLEGIGLDNVTVAGDTRFDRVTAVREAGRDIPAVDCFKAGGPEAFTLVAGSSWPKDEDVYIPWLHATPGARAIIAPHEFDDARLDALCRRLGAGRTMLYSRFRELYEKSPAEAVEIASQTSYLVIDCFGLLSSLYRYADVAYIGGGFGVSIHNINEAAVYGIPVLFGPRHDKFKEARDLIDCGGAFCVRSRHELSEVLSLFASDTAARSRCGRSAGHYIASNVGATRLIMKEMFDINLK